MPSLSLIFGVVAVLAGQSLSLPTEVVLNPQSIIPLSPQPALTPGQEAFISTSIRNQQLNQTFPAGNGPIVAILPAGSNLTATWDLSTGQEPIVGFAKVVASPTPPPLANLSAMPSNGAMITQEEPTANNVVVPGPPNPSVKDTAQVVQSAAGVAAAVAPLLASANSTVNDTQPQNITSANVTEAPMAVAPVVVVPNATQPENITSANVTAAPVAVAPVVVPVNTSQPQNASFLPPPVIPAGGALVPLQNHRIEILLIDFQMNNSANSNITQSIMVSVKGDITALTPTAAVLPLNDSTADATPVGAATKVQTTSDIQPVFNGTYQTSLENKVAIQRTIAEDLCGPFPDKALFTVIVAPLNPADAAVFPQQNYTCTMDLIMPTAVRSSESFWTDIRQCNSGPLAGYSFRLWYKLRQYNIDTVSCVQRAPSPSSLSVASNSSSVPVAPNPASLPAAPQYI